MTFRGLLDRRVTIREQIVTGKDARNDDVFGPGRVFPGVRASRELESSLEERAAEDLILPRWVYVVDLVDSEGSDVSIDGYSLLEDGTDVFSIDGEPELVVRSRGGRPHHFELYATEKV